MLSWDYVAGWFDGDGCVCLTKGYPTLIFSNTDRGVVVAICDFLDVNKVVKSYPPPAPKLHCRTQKQPLHRFIIYRRLDVRRILFELLGRCIVKDKGIVSALKTGYEQEWGVAPNISALPRDRISWEFVAGFLDADGCISYSRGYPNVRFFNNDKNVLEWIRDFLGTGNMYSADCTDYPEWATRHILSIGRRSAVRTILERIGPLCITKADRVHDALVVLGR